MGAVQVGSKQYYLSLYQLYGYIPAEYLAIGQTEQFVLHELGLIDQPAEAEPGTFAAEVEAATPAQKLIDNA